jgi:hypothetical protein
VSKALEHSYFSEIIGEMRIKEERFYRENLKCKQKGAGSAVSPSFDSKLNVGALLCSDKRQFINFHWEKTAKPSKT